MTHNPFESAARAYELETARITALAKAQIDWATAAKIGEEVHGLAITNEGRELALQRARNQLRRLDAERVDREREANRLREHGRNLALYRDGHRLDGLNRQKVWAAFRVLHRGAPSRLLHDWMGTIYGPELLFDQSAWRWVSIGGRPTVPVYPDRAYQLLEFLIWQDEVHQQAVAIVGSFPWRATVAAFEALDAFYGGEVGRLEGEIANIEGGDVAALGLAELIRPEAVK
jgi:hypothetical protein